MKKFTWDSK